MRQIRNVGVHYFYFILNNWRRTYNKLLLPSNRLRTAVKYLLLIGAVFSNQFNCLRTGVAACGLLKSKLKCTHSLTPEKSALIELVRFLRTIVKIVCCLLVFHFKWEHRYHTTNTNQNHQLNALPQCGIHVHCALSSWIRIRI